MFRTIVKALSRGAYLVVKALSRGTYLVLTFGLKKDWHIIRYYMYRHFSKYNESRPPEHRVLTISRSQRLARLLGYTDDQITDVEFPDASILDLPFDDESFDAVMSDQVLEHVEGDPFTAIDESFRVLKPGGIVLHTTCFMTPFHGAPNDDYWRYTPEALELLASRHGEVLDAGGWGNPYVWAYGALGLTNQPVPHARWHPIHWIATKNVRRWAIVTWVLARKSAA